MCSTCGDIGCHVCMPKYIDKLKVTPVEFRIADHPITTKLIKDLVKSHNELVTHVLRLQEQNAALALAVKELSGFIRDLNK